MAHCVFFYAQARMWKFAANVACGPRGEWWRGTFPYSIAYECIRILGKMNKYFYGMLFCKGRSGGAMRERSLLCLM